jgi:copper chaperone CopZ
MKKIFSSFLLAALVISCGSEKKEDLTVKTEKISGAEVQSYFKVWGNCETCKETIENSVQVDGVSGLNWDVDTKMITLRYDTTKVTLDDLEKKIAAAGYDNVKYKGDDKAYEGLPQCCKYERK